MIYTSVKSSQNQDVALGYTAALVLFLLVFSVFILARILGSPWLSRKRPVPVQSAHGQRGGRGESEEVRSIEQVAEVENLADAPRWSGGPRSRGGPGRS